MKLSPRHNSIFSLMIIFDGIILSLTWILAYYLRFFSLIPAPMGIPPADLYFKLIPFLLLIWLGLFVKTNHYQKILERKRHLLEDIWEIYKLCLFNTLAFIGFSYFYEEYKYSRVVLFIFFILHPIFLSLGRVCLRKAIRLYLKSAPERNILLVGSGANFANTIKLHQHSHFENSKISRAILLDDSQENRNLCDQFSIAIHKKPEDWSEFFHHHSLQGIIFALSQKDHSFLEEHLNEIANLIPDIKIVPDLMRYTKLAAGAEIINGHPIIDLHDSPLTGTGRIFKRSMDILGSLLGLTLGAPLFAIIILAIRFTSKGPIFYRQIRTGLDSREFTCFKFRTMNADAEKITGAVFATANDDRPTPLGSLLRKTSLDELPQLYNVLVGEMSLVGPRPERPFFVDQFKTQIPGYMLRHKVKTGITGWAQVNGWRGDTSIEKRIECDLYYIQNWSTWLDLKILLLTIEEVFFGKNAY